MSAVDKHPRKEIDILGSKISYVDSSDGDPIVFLHGNPTSSYLWRNIIPYGLEFGRCLAPDLIGMGRSDKLTNGTYRFVDHYKYLENWFDELSLKEDVTLVLHDWGSALGFHWAFLHPDRVKAIIYMEGIVKPVDWENWPESARNIFQALRSPAGEEMVLDKNVFVENILPGSVIRDLEKEEMDHYRKPFQERESRWPTLTWPREIPIEGEPKDVLQIVEDYGKWMSENDIPKLFINAQPGAILIDEQRVFCRSWKNQREVTVPGIHFIQEDSPDQIGEALADFMRQL